MSVPRLLRIVRQRLRAVFRRDAVDAELARELTLHFEYLVQEGVDQGLSIDEARHAAGKTLGNIPLLEEQCRDHRSVTWLDDTRRDFTFALRMLRRNPVFTAVAVISLALGIGANTAILSLVDAIFRGSFPIPDDSRLVVIRTFPLDNPLLQTHATMRDYFAWRDENRSFDLMGVSLGHNADFGADGPGIPAERIQGQSITSEALAALGVQPIVGRLFTEDETRVEDPHRVIIISHRLWQRRFEARADILGHQVRLDRVDRTVIGVMPERFRYPSENTDYWIPLGVNRAEFQPPQRFFVVTARLKPGVTVAQAQSEMELVSARLEKQTPDARRGWGVRVTPMRVALFGWTLGPFFTIGASVALVLLVACANVGGLLLARGLARSPEMAVRVALGAGRGRIVRQLLTESLVLAAAGGALGVLVAWGGIHMLALLPPPPGGVAIGAVALNAKLLGITALISIVTGLLFGLVPAVISARSSPTDSLKQSQGGGAGVHLQIRTLLVAAQVAVTVVLLVGSGLLMRSLVHLLERDLQFDRGRLLTFELHLPLGDYLKRRGSIEGVPYFEIAPAASTTLERVHHRLQTLPGVESVSGVSMPLLNSVVLQSALISTDTADDGLSGLGVVPSMTLAPTGAAHISDRRFLTASYFLVTPGFFTSLKARLVRGRDFGAGDSASAPWVAIVNESAARLLWPGNDALGRRFRLPNVPEEQWRDVIGVVRDIPLTRQSVTAPVIYTSYLQQPAHYPQPGANMFGRMTFMIRSTGDPMRLLPAVHAAVSEIAPGRPLANVVTMEQQLSGIMPQRGYLALATAALALTATLLAAIGIYGVLAYAVTRRTRELGVRIALGASPGVIVGLVGRRIVLIVCGGLATGLAGALIFTRLLQGQLWGVTATDPATFGAVVAILAFVAVAAAFFPIRRATGVNPTVALRCE